MLEKSNDQDFIVYMESLCNLRTKWVEVGGEKTVKRMDMRPECKVWYQFVKHSLHHTTHNETVDKAKLLLLYCITLFSEVNMGKIIVQEIQACSKKKRRMVYFPFLITALYKRHEVPQKATDEVFHPHAIFDKATIQNFNETIKAGKD